MNAALLLEHYARIADAPDAIARLRRLVLDLAVRGKLVEQDAADEPASELLKRIKAANASDGKKRRGKTRDTSAGNALEDIPFDAPKGWTFACLGELVRVLNGRAYKQQELLDEGTPVLRVGNLFTSNHWYYSDLALDDDKHCNAGDLIYAWSASFGPFIWNGPRVIYHYHIWKLPLVSEADLDKRYLYNFLLQKTREIKEAGHGVSMVHMTKEKMEKLIVPLPPLAEQHRIVTKVDELMALCDQLEAARAEREAARDTFTLSTLAKLNTPDPETLGQDARFALANLAPLTTRADQIKQLRQTILNLAVRGKLVEQDAADGSGLDYMAALPNADQVKGRGRRIVASSKIEASEEYLDIPQQWTWARIHEIGVTQTGTSPSSANPDLFGDFIPFVKPGDLDGATISYDGPGLSEQGVSQSRLAPAATVLMVCIGATLGKVNITDRDVCFNQQINSVTPYVPGTSPFLALALKASGFQQLAWSKAGTGTLPIISKGKWEILPVPVPPLAEQHRIVAKVDVLMALCDQLETSISTGEQTRSRLLESVLHHALEPA